VELVSPLGQAGAIGAKTFVYPARSIGGTQIGLCESKSKYGYLAQDDPLLHFGLGDHLTVDVVVEALDGTQTIMTEAPANQTIWINMK
jgi:hypothetical protein